MIALPFNLPLQGCNLGIKINDMLPLRQQEVCKTRGVVQFKEDCSRQQHATSFKTQAQGRKEGYSRQIRGFKQFQD
jgi:hypothetical protein